MNSHGRGRRWPRSCAMLAAEGSTPATQAAMVAAKVFAALGDATRLKLVALLCAGSTLSIAQLTASTEISRQGVTKHLQVLADAGVVRDLKRGRERLWQLEPADRASQIGFGDHRPAMGHGPGQTQGVCRGGVSRAGRNTVASHCDAQYRVWPCVALALAWRAARSTRHWACGQLNSMAGEQPT